MQQHRGREGGRPASALFALMRRLVGSATNTSSPLQRVCTGIRECTSPSTAAGCDLQFLYKS